MVKRLIFDMVLVASLIGSVAGQDSTPSKTPTSDTQNVPALPYCPSLDVSSMDKSFDPCVDFYQYSCGGWQKKNPIPPDQTSWSVYAKLYQDNLAFLRGLLEEAGKTPDTSDPVGQKIG